MADTPKQHAPKGRIKANLMDDPINEPDPIHQSDPLRCKAHTRSGRQCGSHPIRGGAVCRMHGGGAPQVKAKAMDRLMALQHPAIDRLGKLIDQETFPTVAYAASRDVLDRTLGKPTEQQTVDVKAELVIKWAE
jgi:hypothetical protein